MSDLLPVFKSVFKAAASDGQNNETLFQDFFQSMINTETGDKMNILDQKASAAECTDGTKLPVKQFLGVLHNQLLTDFLYVQMESRKHRKQFDRG